MAFSASGVTEIFDCDTDGMSGGTGTLDTDIKIEGGASLKLKVSGALGVIAKYDQGTAVGVDMSSQHFGIWIMTPATLDTDANGGIRCYFEDISGNYKECYVSGSDTYAGGWQYMVCSYNATGDSTFGVYDSSAHRYCGIRFKTLSKATSYNVWWDCMHYFNEITCSSGATDQVDEDDLVSWCAANGNGLVTEYNGAYFSKTGIIWGSSLTNIDYKSNGKKIFFVKNSYKSNTLYKWKVIGGPGTTTNFEWGIKSGTNGIGGNVIIDTNLTNQITIDFNSSYIDILKIYGGSFENVGQVDFPNLSTALHELLSTIFDDHGIIYPRIYSMKYGKSISAQSDAFSISSTTFNVQYWEIISPTDSGIWTSSDLSHGVNFQSITFIGTNGTTSYDVENTHATADFLINLLGTSVVTYKNENPGTITANLSVTISLSNIISGSTLSLDAFFSTDTPAGAYNGTGDSILQITIDVPSSLSSSGNVRVWNGNYYDEYSYTGKSGKQLTGVSPVLTQDYDGVKLLLEIINPKTVTTDPEDNTIDVNIDFEVLIAKSGGTPEYKPVFFTDNSGSGFSRRISQQEDG